MGQTEFSTLLTQHDTFEKIDDCSSHSRCPGKRSMVKEGRRPYHRVGEDTRVRIISLRERGTSQRGISRLLKLKHSTVDAIIKKWKTHHSLADRPKMGRPALLDDRTKRLLARRMLSGELLTATQVAQAVLRDYSIHISSETARALLQEQRLKCMRTIHKPRLTKDHKRSRLKFALAYRDWTVDDWKRVVFSDETIITGRPYHTRPFKWTKTTKGMNPSLVIPTVQGGGPKIMVWGYISRHGCHDLVLLDGTVNAQRYIDTLRDHLLPIRIDYFQDEQFVFQQDKTALPSTPLMPSLNFLMTTM